MIDFESVVVAGTILVREAIQSPNYVAGVSGWTINQDGSAEFNDVTIRGELLVTDPDGSYVRIYDQDPGSGALIEFGLPTASGSILTPGSITSTDSVAGSGEPGLVFVSATVDGTPTGVINLISNTTLDISEIDLAATDVSIDTDGSSIHLLGSNVTIGFDAPGGFLTVDGSSTETTFEGNVTVDGSIDVNGTRTVVNNKEILNTAQTAGTTTSATYVNLPGTSSLSFAKIYGSSDTKLCVALSVGARTTGATFTAVRFAVQINGVDTDIAHTEMATIGAHEALSGAVEISGLAANTYTVQVRYRRVSGAGTVAVDTNDWLSLTVEEVPV